MTTIPLLPVLSRTSPTFKADLDAAFLTGFNSAINGFNTVAGEVEADAATAASGAATATTQVGLATTQANNAALSASLAAAAADSAGAVLWVSGTTYALGHIVYSPITFTNFRRKVAGAGTTDPSLDTINWASTVVKPSLVRSVRTSNTALTTSDLSALIDITGGTFTQTFAATATLGNGWFCYFRNSGTGDITLYPNASELIDGLTSYVMYPGEVRLVQCDGTALRSIVLNSFYRVFTASGTFTKPPGYRRFEGLCWSGGNSGSKHPTNGFGGGGGGCAPFSVKESLIGTTQSVVIGAGGAPSDTGSGKFGGSTTFGVVAVYPNTLSFQYGGSLLKNRVEMSPVGFEGAYSAAYTAIYGGGASANGTGGAGGGSLYGGGGGGGVYTTESSAGGTSVYGGSGGASAVTTNGLNGVAPGGGGGGTITGAQSGAGARGELRIWGVI